MIRAVFMKDHALTEKNDPALALFHQNCYGELTRSKCVKLSLIETLYLLEKERIEVIDGRKKIIDADSFFEKATRAEPNFFARYAVFKDFRERGYIIKTALKFGADFRVYDRGVKPGDDHARWIVYPVKETVGMTWHEFAAKNRVAHSTKKRLLIAIVDDEGDVTYYEVKWTRP
jgi:tRNA-intron endonuclease, archaea type